jgi:nucleoside-diphosphate-sugar epimerase
MRILITGNMGYIGPSVVKQLRATYPEATIIGFDMGYFAQCLTNTHFLPECQVNKQIFGDVREFPESLLGDIDAVIYLSAISNDPMGKLYEDITLDVNYRAGVRIAKQAKKAGVKSFVFASSCSVYGAGGEGAKTEASEVNPLTAYAKSKIFSERELIHVADETFKVTALRFSTACGMSERLRLDLVVNDFVASAVASKKITILSDGTPWRPLIHIKDMARAMDWAILRDAAEGGNFLAVNVGRKDWNYQVKDLAEAVAEVIPGTEVSLNSNAQPDKRSYQVDFSKFEKLAPDHQPLYDLKTTVVEIRKGLEEMNFQDESFRDSEFMRLKVLTRLGSSGYLTEDLKWDYYPKETCLTA